MQLVILYSSCGRLHAFSLQFTRRRQFCTHLLNVNKYCLILLRLFDRLLRSEQSVLGRRVAEWVS